MSHPLRPTATTASGRAMMPQRVVDIWLLSRIVLQLTGTLGGALLGKTVAPANPLSFDLGGWGGLFIGSTVASLLTRYRFGGTDPALIRWSFGTPFWLLPAASLIGAAVAAYLTWPTTDPHTGQMEIGGTTAFVLMGGLLGGGIAFALVVARRRLGRTPTPR